MPFSILLVIDKPHNTDPSQRDHKLHDSYDNAVKHIRGLINTNKEIQAFGENVFLLKIDDALYGLSETIGFLHDYKAAYRYAILTEDLKWQTVDKRAMTP